MNAVRSDGAPSPAEPPLGVLPLRGAGGEPVDLRRTLGSHGVAGLPPRAGYERFTKWLGYPATFLYVALGYAFVSTGNIEQALKIIFNVVRLPLAWIHGAVL